MTQQLIEDIYSIKEEEYIIKKYKNDLKELDLNVKHTGLYGNTALIQACKKEFNELTKALIEADKDKGYKSVGIYNDHGETALLITCRKKTINTQYPEERIKNNDEIIYRLIDTGESNPGHLDYIGNTALLIIIKKDISNKFNGNIIAEKLIKTGKSKPGHVDKDGMTALMYAIKNEYFDIAKKLIDTGESEPGHVDKKGNTALSIVYELYKENLNDKKILDVLVYLIKHFYVKYFEEKKDININSNISTLNRLRNIFSIFSPPIQQTVTILDNTEQKTLAYLQKICKEQNNNEELKNQLKEVSENVCAIPIEEKLPVGTIMEKPSKSYFKKPQYADDVDKADEIITAEEYPEDVVNYHVNDIYQKKSKGEIVLEKDFNKPEIPSLEEYLIKLIKEGLTKEEVGKIHRGVYGAVPTTPNTDVGSLIPKRTNLRSGGKKNRRTVRRKKTVHPRRKTTRRKTTRRRK